MSGWLIALGPAGTALALLVLGHVLGDFLFQPEEMATNKHRVGPLLAHGGIVLVVHGITFLPLLTPRTALLVGLVGAVHVPIDAVSARLRHREARPRPTCFSATRSPTSSSSSRAGPSWTPRRGRSDRR